ncbi:DUF262 domain-containing HNH endonuclease family protein [Stenotrophomonas sp. Y6]|uniref:DUF262 domain-containing protein n=1 Tax=Stenotrophomonas sp. Y6 TaxID=2920383 RepID=UPI001F054E9E|nr:DUF262 domain-containing protein [Stenotrophomonas sp. Y6]MCH1908693.1 DUF262 domain-containing HNH endonuclease family protein [Stenotrophomonas sp. Y6]
MDNQLLTLSKIFTERLFRIPDYQRGYAWGEKQLRDFWSDLDQLEDGQNHYTGVLTLENVPVEVCEKWGDDAWIINSKKFEPLYVVDGQQRLTTSIILIQVILENIDESIRINYNTKEEVQKKFIFDSKDGGISRSYIFGYEKDNPSYEFLKSRIFCEKITSGDLQETIYTQNLQRAKDFFQEKLNGSSVALLEDLYKRVTQNLLFNIFTISSDVDVCVAFETMNNRGKPLSYLELLKNRLIYLSYKIPVEDYERARLRSAINDCWRALYHSLGRNKYKPLDDDSFLFSHYIIYFGRDILDVEADIYVVRRRISKIDYPADLLGRRFVVRNVFLNDGDPSKITLGYVFDYVSSLQESVEVWYKILNPEDSGYSEDEKKWLDKMNRIGFYPFLPLTLVVFRLPVSSEHRVAFLKALERFSFCISIATKYYSKGSLIHYRSDFIKMALDMADDAKNGTAVGAVEKATKHVVEMTNAYLKAANFRRDLVANFKTGGFYAWDNIKYFLYEYNLSLQERSKTNRDKIDWDAYNEDVSDYITVEHIYPQHARHQYWVTRFGKYPQKRKELLRNSLGNLLPLSRPKNSSLSNRPFDEKVKRNDGSVVSYAFGSYAENEVAQAPEWTSAQILSRGLSLLAFMEKRWGLSLGDEGDKKALLGLDFL